MSFCCVALACILPVGLIGNNWCCLPSVNWPRGLAAEHKLCRLVQPGQGGYVLGQVQRLLPATIMVLVSGPYLVQGRQGPGVAVGVQA